MHAHEELLGADFFEHDIRHAGVGVSRAVSVLKHYHDEIDASIEPKGENIGEKLLKSFCTPNNIRALSFFRVDLLWICLKFSSRT